MEEEERRAYNNYIPDQYTLYLTAACSVTMLYALQYLLVVLLKWAVLPWVCLTESTQWMSAPAEDVGVTMDPSLTAARHRLAGASRLPPAAALTGTE